MMSKMKAKTNVRQKKGHGLNLQVKNANEIGLKSKYMLLIKDTIQPINGTIQKRALFYERKERHQKLGR